MSQVLRNPVGQSAPSISADGKQSPVVRYGRQVFSTELQLGLELSRLWLLDGRLEDVEQDYRSWTTVAQLSNRSAYLGYQLVTRIGLQISRKRFDDERTQRVSAFFLTVHAGLR